MKKTIYLCALAALAIFLASCRTADPLATPTQQETAPLTSATETELPETGHTFGKYYTDKQAAATIGSGCSIDTNQFADQSATRCYDGKVYFFGGYKKIYPVPGSQYYEIVFSLLAYDLKTGDIFPACRDAACSHTDSGCPFYSSRESRVKDLIVDEKGVIYLTMSDPVDKNDDWGKGTVYGIYSYDLHTGILTRICTREMKTYANMRKVGEWLYYTNIEYHKDDNGYDMYYWRYSDKTHKSEKLFLDRSGREYSDFGILRLIEEDGRTFIVSIDEMYNDSVPLGDICVTDIKNRDSVRRLTDSHNSYGHFYTYNDNLYYVMHDAEAGGNVLCINKIDIKTGKQSVLAKDVYGFPYMAGKYIYYFPYKPERIEVEGEEKPLPSYSRGEIIRIDLETEETESIKIPDTFCFWSSSLGTFYYNGRIFGSAIFYSPELMENGENTGYIELDITTGEFRKVPFIVCIGH